MSSFSIEPEDMATAEEIDGKKVITIEKMSLGPAYEKPGTMVNLELPDGTTARGKILARTEVPKTLVPGTLNVQCRFLIEIQPE